MNTLQFFIDFDGTITTTDAVDLMLDRFAGNSWQAVEKEWTEGKIGSRECLARQIELVRATPEELNRLMREVKVDPHFVSFLNQAEACGVPVTILSDGFDVIIEQVLRQTLEATPRLLKAIPVFSNKMEWKEGRWKAVFPHEMMCSHGCANCKPVIMTRLSSKSDTVVFVGDGLSDRFAARKANVVFAKGKLLDYCRENQLSCKKYSSFKEINSWLSKKYGKKGLFSWIFRKLSS